MSKPIGYHFYCIVVNKKLVSTQKLTPQIMLNLVRYIIETFGDKDYDTVADLFDYWPVDFSLRYSKPVQSLYIDYDDNHNALESGFIVYAKTKTNAEKAMNDWLKDE